MPKDFPFDSVETAVDYESVHLGTGTFLLPVHAANIACRRGTSICTKNESTSATITSIRAKVPSYISRPALRLTEHFASDGAHGCQFFGSSSPKDSRLIQSSSAANKFEACGSL